MPRDAFLIIDVQNDFCPGGALAVADGDAVVPVVNALQGRFPLVVATQDWHPANHLSFAANHIVAHEHDETCGGDGCSHESEHLPPYSSVEMPYGPQILWPIHCVQGTPGAAFHDDLDTERVALIVRKGFRRQIDSYSAFFENDHATPTGLAGYLREHGVERVTLAGLATDFCVRYSAVDAAKLGFAVRLVEDGCRAIDLDGSLDAAMDEMRAHGVTFVRSRDLTI